MGNRLEHIGMRLMVVVAGCVIGLVIAEVLLRLIGFQFAFYPTKVQIGWPDPVTIKEMYKPDRDLLWVTKNYSGREATAANGKHPALVFMGCSCTQFGEYDKDLADRIGRDHPGRDFTFRNLGVGGWTSFQGLQQFKRDVIPMKPRVVTIYYGWNDHWCTFGLADKQILQSQLEHSAVMAKVIAKSRVLQLVDKVAFARSFQGMTRMKRVSLVDFHSNLTEMIRLARENGIVPVLLTAPSSHRVGKEPAYLEARWLKDRSELVPLHESYVEVVRQVAAETGADLVDLYRLFRALPPAELQASFQGDGIHLSASGDRRISLYLDEYFEKTGLIGKLFSPGGQSAPDHYSGAAVSDK